MNRFSPLQMVQYLVGHFGVDPEGTGETFRSESAEHFSFLKSLYHARSGDRQHPVTVACLCKADEPAPPWSEVIEVGNNTETGIQ
jgi:hypothetical protein